MGGIFCGHNCDFKSIFHGSNYIGVTIGVQNDVNSDRVQQFFEQQGNLINVREGDEFKEDLHDGRQYAFMTSQDFFIESNGYYAPTTALTQNSNTLLMGNSLSSGTTVYQDIFNYVTNSTESVKQKLVNGLKNNKINGLDKRITNQSCYCVKLIVIDLSGNVIESQTWFSKTEEPIDLLT